MLNAGLLFQVVGEAVGWSHVKVKMKKSALPDADKLPAWDLGGSRKEGHRLNGNEASACWLHV